MSIWKAEWDELVEAAYINAAAGIKKSVATQEIDYFFANIVQLWVASINARDTWTFYLGSEESHWCYYGTARSKKLEVDFDFGLYEGMFYLDTYFVHPSRIRYMSDDFWEHLVELNKYGNCRFTENAGLSGVNGNLLYKYSSSRSNVFNIIKNHLLLEIFGKGSADLGGIEVTWPMDVDRKELLVNGAIALSHMYRMNYLLYRSYQQHLYGKKRSSES